jgi:transcriptional regulator with XRE-family HTH domain
MSTNLNHSISNEALSEARRQVWRLLFGEMIGAIREKRRCSVQEAAHLSGMELSEWLAIEAGYVPTDPVRLRSMAAALEIGLEQLSRLVAICHGA